MHVGRRLYGGTVDRLILYDDAADCHARITHYQLALIKNVMYVLY